MTEATSPADLAKARLKRFQKLQTWALKSQEFRRLNAMVSLARSEPGIPISPDEMDCDPMLFNVLNGTLELRTGKLREHRREDHIQKLCPTAFDENAACPRWRLFLDEVFLGDVEVIDFVRRLFGYCLTGDVREHVLPIFWGCGGNGKSVLLKAVVDVMGKDYAMKASADLLTVSKGDRHPTELAQLHGMRLVVASESEQGARVREALIKDMTGGESVRARRVREDFWEFQATHKLILQTNHKPQVTGSDEGIWRRLRLVPFEARFRKPDEAGGKASASEKAADTGLSDKLLQERSGILAWMVSGCLDWQRHGLGLPEKVKAATSEYRQAEDVVAAWVEERCLRGEGYRTRAGDLFASFKAWCESVGEATPKQKSFGDAMTERGFCREKSNGVWYRGIAVRHQDGRNDGTME